MSTRRTDLVVALAYGLACHGLFAAGTGVMNLNLFFGMQLGLAPEGVWAVPWNLALVAQFVFFHSWMLSRPGTRFLRGFVPQRYGSTLDTTMFATAAALQTGLLFTLWSPLPYASYTLTGFAWWVSLAAFAASALFLGVALWEAGLGIQLRYTGWTALWRGDRPRYPKSFASTGLHGLIRHPIYLGFVAVMWTGPVWSVDKLLLAIPLTLYCVLGPRRKEARLLARHGAEYADYLARTPSFLPRAAKPETAVSVRTS
jgi:protein-S-isoprenylcysteine O-methyltransferase Ste14